MASPQNNRRPSVKEIGAVAEIIVSDKNYRDALNAPFVSEEPSVDMDEFHEHEEAANTVLAYTIKEVGVNADPETRKWEAGRIAIVSMLSKKALGSFEDYFLGVNSIPTIEEAKQKELPNGEYKVVQTNHKIVRYSRDIEDPIEFFDTSLGVVERQEKLGKNNVGPENYSTALKLFSDKYSLLEHDCEKPGNETLALPDLTDVKELTNEAVAGFCEIARSDAPNYLEMTNVFAAIRALPKGVFDPKYTEELLLYATKSMNQYDNRASQTFLGAMPKLDTSEHPLAAAAMVNLMLNRLSEFKSTRELRTTVRAIDSLQKTPQTDAAIRKFFELAEGFEEPLDLEGIDEVVDRLNHILNDKTEDLGLSVQTKNFANKCMSRANQIAYQILNTGNLTQAQTSQLKETYTRIKTNYQAL